MTNYVVGFMHSDEDIVLIRKNRPAWQAGRLNGVGGKVNPLETPYKAMIREFEEEAGVKTTSWREFLIIDGPSYRIYFYENYDPTYTLIDKVHSKTDEQLEIHNVRDVMTQNIIKNLTWAIPLAMYREDLYPSIRVVAGKDTA